MMQYPRGIYVPGPVGYHPGDEVSCERFCAACACSQKALGGEPCWNCGGETSPTRPAFWQAVGANQTVRNGDTWPPGEDPA